MSTYREISREEYLRLKEADPGFFEFRRETRYYVGIKGADQTLEPHGETPKKVKRPVKNRVRMPSDKLALAPDHAKKAEHQATLSELNFAVYTVTAGILGKGPTVSAELTPAVHTSLKALANYEKLGGDDITSAMVSVRIMNLIKAGAIKVVGRTDESDSGAPTEEDDEKAG